LEEILGKRPFSNRTTYDEFVNGAIDGGGVPQTDLPIDPIPDEKAVDNSTISDKKS